MKKSALPVLSVIMYICAGLMAVGIAASLQDIFSEIGTSIADGYIVLPRDMSMISNYVTNSFLVNVAIALVLIGGGKALQYLANLQDALTEKDISGASDKLSVSNNEVNGADDDE